MEKFTIVYPPTLDYNFMKQRPQHLMEQFANEGHNVLYFNVNRQEKDPEEVTPNLWVIYREEDFSTLFKRLEERKVLLWISYSKHYNWSKVHADFVVYDCLDDFENFRKYEDEMFKRADVVFTTSDVLFERVSKKHNKVYMCKNGCDYHHFSNVNNIITRPKDVPDISGPIVGYIGAFAHWVDTDILKELCENGVNVVVIGAHFGAENISHPNFHYSNEKPYDLLPNYISFFDCLIIPFKINQITLATNPIKMWEYLATGKPIVSTSLPEVVIHEEEITIGNKIDFTSKVLYSISRDNNDKIISKRKTLARENSWDSKYSLIKEVLQKELPTISPVNSKKYWEKRFSKDWSLFEGREQTLFFSDILIENLPEIVKESLEKGVSVCDVGCAEGQNVNNLSIRYPNSTIQGIDFSNEAIRTAKELYKHNQFYCGDIENIEKNYDLIISSNTLEHLSNPWEVVGKLLKRTDRYLVLLLPFQENPTSMLKEHFSRFDYNNFPLIIDNFNLVYHKVIDCTHLNGSKWHGKQILVVYSSIFHLTGKTLDLLIDNNQPLRPNKEKIKSTKNIQKKIFVGAPVRNRARILPRYIESLKKQNISMETCFIVNDCEDNTEEILQKANFNIIKKDYGMNNGYIRGEYSKENLADLRNTLLDEFLKSDCEYLLSVDTDIIIPENSVNQLIENDKDIVSMLIKNSDVLNAHNIYIDGKHVEEVPEGLIPVDMTGAVYLIKRSVIESGVRYAHDKLGEDIPFCKSAREQGFEIYCDTRLRPIHVFKEGLDLVASTKKTVIFINSFTEIRNQIFDILETSRELIEILIHTFSEEGKNSWFILLQDLIDAFNQIGESLEPVLKSSSNSEVLEEDFEVIDNSVGRIIRFLESDDHKSAVEVINNDLKNIISKWKKDLDIFFMANS